jgi:hypothetical protein
MGKHIALVLFAAVTLSACADEPDYYTGELVPTRPDRKPSLDPTTPAGLTGGQNTSQYQNPPINQEVLPTSLQFDHSSDGRITWADNITTSDGLTQTQLHSLNSGTGIDDVTVLDELGNEQYNFQLRYTPDQLNALRQ